MRAAACVLGVGAAALLVMLGAFWALLVLPFIAFLVLTIAMSVVAAGKPRGRSRFNLLADAATGSAREVREGGQ